MAAASEILDTLSAWDLSHVFCCPGTSETALLDALAERDVGDTAQFLLTTHESIAVSMADGYARASGRIGVAYVHTNVGLANGLAHVYAAQVARSSVAVLTGIKATGTLPHRALTTSPRILETAAPYAGHTWQNLDGTTLVDDLDRALWRTTVVPESPSVLTIPQNHLTGPPSGSTSAGRRRAIRTRPAQEDLRLAAKLLRTARRPLIVAGSDVARRGAQRSLERIAESIGAPVVVESRRDLERWSFSTDHPAFAGVFNPRDALTGEADLLFLAGAPTPLEFASDVPILPADVPLLHLTEDPSEAGRRVIAAHSLVGDTALALAELAEALGRLPGASSPEASGFRRRMRRARAEQQRAWRASVSVPDDGSEFSAAAAMRTLADVLGGAGVLVLDGVTSTLPLLRFLERTSDDTLFATASGSLGWGMGAAAGVALARRSRVIAVVGDGVVQFGVPALWTVKRYGIPVTYVVVNNGRYQAVISGLARMNGAAHASGSYPLTDISGVDIAALAASFGIPSVRVDGATGLGEAVQEELGRGPADGPRLIEVMVDDTLWP